MAPTKTEHPVKAARKRIMQMVDDLPESFTEERALVFLAELDDVLESLYQKGYANSIKPNKN